MMYWYDKNYNIINEEVIEKIDKEVIKKID
jgi:hypothetical protein